MLNAQSTHSPLTLKNDKISEQLKNFEDLKAQGFTKEEIYQDLGNAYFLSKNYETALFWYDRLLEISDNGRLESSYQRRYDYAVSKIGQNKAMVEDEDENWTELVRSDYQMTSTTSDKTKYSYRDTFKPLNFNSKSEVVTLSTPDRYNKGNDKYAPTIIPHYTLQFPRTVNNCFLLLICQDLLEHMIFTFQN